ncbi:MAG: OmpA family protein [Bacteroidia bacterium]|nr:OmpA family protein [Bacteroidia bacterium]
MKAKLHILFLLAGFLLLLHPACLLAQDKPEQLIEKGDFQMKKSPPDFSAALYFFQEAEKKKRDDNSLLLKIGICYLHLDSAEAVKAIPYLKRCFDYSPNLDDDLEFMLARAYELGGETKLAISKYREYKNTLSSAQLKQKKISTWAYSIFSTERQPYTAEKTIIYDLDKIIEERIAACMAQKNKPVKDPVSFSNQDLGPSGAVTLFSGSVIDETGNPIRAEIKVWDSGTGELFGEFNSNSKTGKYLLSLPVGKPYHIEFTCPNLLPFWALVDFPIQAEFSKLIRPIQLFKNKATFQNIRFEFFKERIAAQSTFALEKLNQLAKSQSGKKFTIQAHTSSIGSEETRKNLSFGRATELSNWLIKLGMDPNRIKPVGLGSAAPLLPETDEKGNQDLDAMRFNERIELIIQ